MGKTKKLHLANRILAMMLAVAMSVTMIPSTALAAPADDPAVDEIVDVTAEGNGDVVDVDMDDDTDDVNTDVDDTNTDVDDTNTDVDDTNTDVDDTNTDVDDTNKDVDDTDVDDANKDTDGANSANAKVNAEETAPAASSYKIVWQEGVEYDTKVEYDGHSHFDDFTAKVELQKDGVAVNPAETITATYKKGADGTDLAGAPTEAGSYKVVLTCAAVAGVHETVTMEVECEITKAPVKITLTEESRTVKPGTKRNEVPVPVIDRVFGGTECNVNRIDNDQLTLTITKIRDAVTGTEIVDANAELKQDGGYVMDLTPAYTTDTTKFQGNDKAAFENNFDLQPFTADIVVADLIQTQVVIKLADKWKTEDQKTNNQPATQITYEYTGETVAAPAEGADKDYTVEVQYYDEKETDPTKQWKTLTKEVAGGEVTTAGKWLDDFSQEMDAPKGAGTYEYQVKYPGKDGVYAASYAYDGSDRITVEITPKKLTVEPDSTEALEVAENSTVADVLAQIDYKVLDKDGKDVKAAVRAAHIWGTGYDSTSKSQIYEPLFTMQQSADGTTWTDINDSARLQKDVKYRAVFTGRKAIFTTGSVATIVTDINSASGINGVDTNYHTDYTFDQAKTKTREVKVKAGTKAVIDVSALVKDGEGAATIEGLKPKQYDGKSIYPSRSAYRNVVKLKGEGADGTPIHTEQREFTYTWERYTGGDWIDAQIELKNGTAVDSLTWSEELDRSGKPIVSPIDAGVYRLTVSYEDKIDPDAYYYADDAVLYFAIDKRQVTITPTKESYEILAGKDSGDFFHGEEEIKYTVAAADGKDLPSDAGYFTAHGQILETITVTGVDPVTSNYVQDSDYVTFEYDKENPTHYTYKLQGYGLRQRNKSDGSWVLAPNYTCESSEVVMNGTTAERKNTPLNTTERTITVVPMGTQAVTITADTTKWVAKEKVYDAKPFAEADLVPAGLVSVKKADGTDAAVKLTYNTGINSYGYFEELKDITEAGTYDLYVCFLGDKDYAPYCNEDGSTKNVKLGTFKITKREITLTADMDKNYPAGTAVSDITGAVWNNYQATGYAPGQEEFFTKDWEGNMSAWSGLDFYVTEKDGKRLYDYDCLKRNKTYEVRYDKDNSSLDSYDEWDSVNGVYFNPSNDYTVKNAPVATFETVPGNSEIESVDWEGIAAIQTQDQNDKEDPLKREVKMTEAIPWSTYEFVGSGEGNFVAFQITAPAEYGQMPATAMYENAIKAKGGYVAGTGYDSFIAVFDAAKGDTTFAIRWEDGYVETYTLKFDEAVKLPNLEDAVAPKSLAFNAANKTMAVGQGQALDVKITKEQMGDVIYLGYKSENEDILAVNENGYVTALKMGTGTITVFAQHEVKGEPVPIWDAKKGEGTYAKSAKLQIKVTRLDAPKKLKATAHEQSIDLNYDSPAYGYRREIYVMEKEKAGSYKTPADFDKLLSGMKENQWKAKGFAIAPVYITLGTENSNRNANNYVRRLRGLDIRKEYRIYVRNVCAVRTLNSYYGKGAITQAAMEESASGAVIDVKTKRAEVNSLDASLFYHDNKDGAWVYDENGNHVLQLSKMKGTVESRPIGGFPAVSPQDELSTDDLVWIDLPFSKEDKTTYGGVYEEPKLEFLLENCYDKKTDTWGLGTKNDYASIDKKGKIKITGLPDDGDEDGVCDLYVMVRDTVTGEYDWGSVPLMAENADSVTAAKKSVAMSVGQWENLENLLTYSIGRTKLTAYPNRSLDLAKVREAIRTQNQAEYFELDEWGNLTAIQGGGKLELELTDTNVAKVNADKATAKVTITSRDVDAIKSLKACDVNYNKFGLTFVYPGYDNADGFLLEVYDAKKPIYSKVIDKWDSVERVHVTDKDGRYVYKRDAKGSLSDEDGTLYGFAYVKDTYMISDDSIRQMMGGKLTKDSQYTVSLTPISHGKKAKAASTKVKTTKIPAVDGYLTNEIYDEDYYADNSNVWACNQRGGMEIVVSEYDSNRRLSGTGTTLRATSGNTYTLTAEVWSNRGRVNDTLVWSVGDSKVATVKAAAGSYCITLTGVKQGETTLEVRSKLLGNKVIARYDITVSPVQDAKPQYYGENEPE